jgi:hypothetical protein
MYNEDQRRIYKIWQCCFRKEFLFQRKNFKSLQQDCKELIKLLIAIIKTAKSNSK